MEQTCDISAPALWWTSHDKETNCSQSQGRRSSPESFQHQPLLSSSVLINANFNDMFKLQTKRHDIGRFSPKCQRTTDRWTIEKWNHNFPRGCLNHWQGTNVGIILSMEHLEVSFTKMLPDWDFKQECYGYYQYPTSTRPTQRISIAILFGGQLFDRISCMWGWDWTTVPAYRSGPQTWTWVLSLTMQPRHYGCCAVWT